MKTLAHTASLILLLASGAMAKRTAPAQVPAITTDKAVFSVPHTPMGERAQSGGFVEARNPKTKKLLWRIQIYKTLYDPGLELDVQNVFITTLSYDKIHNLLIMSDEKKRVFVLNLVTRKVTQIR